MKGEVTGPSHDISSNQHTDFNTHNKNQSGLIPVLDSHWGVYVKGGRVQECFFWP